MKKDAPWPFLVMLICCTVTAWCFSMRSFEGWYPTENTTNVQLMSELLATIWVCTAFLLVGMHETRRREP